MVPQPPEFLIKRLRDKECILFVGSGLSAAARLPTWSDLLVDITAWADREHPGKVQSSEVKELLAKDRLLEVAQHLRDVLSLEVLHRALSERLQVATCPVPEVHQLITKLPFQFIITTNFDALIEKAFDDKIPVATQLDADRLAEYIGNKERFLFKAHGTLGRSETIVLTEDDFERMVNDSEAFQRSFTGLFMNYAILFVGYSVADQDFRLLFGRHARLFGLKGPPRYSLMKGLTSIERENLRSKSIQVISYENHDEVPEFFRDLISACKGDSRATETTTPKSSLENVLRPKATSESDLGRRTPVEIITRVEHGTAFEVESLLLDEDREVSMILQEHLGGQRYERLRILAKRNYEQRKERAAFGNVVIVPGFMGSELYVRNSLVWVSAWRLIVGRLGTLNVDQDGSVVTPGTMKRFYGDLMLHLRDRWNVHDFPYDWRLDLGEVADKLNRFLISKLDDGAPCHIVAHGSGGLVVRAFIQKYPATWERLCPGAPEDKPKGGRFVMLGTPNHGWFASVTLLTGKEDLLKKLAFLDLTRDAEDIRRLFASFPSIYQMLPSPRHRRECEALYDSQSYGGLHVSQSLLDRGFAFHETIGNAVDPERMFSILGHGVATTSAVEQPNNLTERGHWIVTTEGDGRTAHALAKVELNGVSIPTYFANEHHADLAMSRQVLGAVDEILRLGTTFGLTTDPYVPIQRVTPEEKLGQ